VLLAPYRRAQGLGASAGPYIGDEITAAVTLSQAMKDAGKVFEMKIYPSFGKSAREAHSFAYLGSSVWADDVFRFLEKHCAK